MSTKLKWATAVFEGVTPNISKFNNWFCNCLIGFVSYKNRTLAISTYNERTAGRNIKKGFAKVVRFKHNQFDGIYGENEIWVFRLGLCNGAY